MTETDHLLLRDFTTIGGVSANEFKDPELLNKVWVYDDGIVKGMMHLEGKEISELYVDYFFWNQGIGAQLLEIAKEKYDCRFQKTRYNVPGLFCVPKAFKTFKEWWDKTNAHNIEQCGRYRYNYKQLLQSINLSISE